MMDMFGLQFIDDSFDRVVFKAPGDAFCHDVCDLGGSRIGTVSNGTAHNITVGQHADQSVILTNRQATNFVIPHLSRCLSDRKRWCDPFCVVGHDFSYKHGVLLQFAAKPWHSQLLE